MLKSTILSTVAFLFLFVGWGITPAQAHIGETCLHKDPNHQHCNGDESVRTLEDLNCTTDQIPKYDGAQWGCAADTNAETICMDGEVLNGDGICVDLDALQVQIDALQTQVEQFQEQTDSLQKCILIGELPSVSGSFRNNCDGTVTDEATGLMWEKKRFGASVSCLDDDNLHSVDATCNWHDATGPWLDKLNNRCNNDPSVDCSAGGDSDCETAGVGGMCGFAGYRNWRVPTVNRSGGAEEFETIVNCIFGMPCIDPIFGQTSALSYWTSTTDPTHGSGAWVLNHNEGIIVDATDKTANDLNVRAVRTVP